MTKKVLILGAKGMLGQALARVFSDADLSLWDLNQLDITDQQQVEQKILSLQPQIIINAAAYTDVDGCETNEDLAVRVNGLAVGYLASVAKHLGAILVHYSTDYVFDGQNSAGYKESDPTNPVNAYGRTKLRGEQELTKKGEKYYLIRTAWLYGPGGKNFVDTILTKAKSSDKLKVVNDQFGKPTYTLDLAQATRNIVEQNQPFGIYHITNQAPASGITWYEFAQAAVKLKNLSAEIEPCSTEEFPRPAQRPKYSMLINTKIKPMREWQEALNDYLKYNYE